MDRDEIEFLSPRDAFDGNLPDAGGNPPAPCEPVPPHQAGGQDLSGAPGVAALVASAIIDSSTASHSIIVTVIVAVSVLAVALAPPKWAASPTRNHEQNLEGGLHAAASPRAYGEDGTNRRLDVIRPIGGCRAVEPELPVSASDPDSQAGFMAFWEAHYRYYLMMLMAVGATLEDAEDTISDVMEDMLRKNTWARLTKAKAWVRRAVLHTYYDWQKRERRRQRLEGEVANCPAEGYLDSGLSVREDWQWVAQMLSTLPPTQRSVVEKVIAELGAKEVAELLGKTPDGIRQNLAHARRRLRANLGNDYRVDRTRRPATAQRKEDAS
jgi:RNA polymerase sigma factor (sigma-70 family)